MIANRSYKTILTVANEVCDAATGGDNHGFAAHEGFANGNSEGFGDACGDKDGAVMEELDDLVTTCRGEDADDVVETLFMDELNEAVDFALLKIRADDSDREGLRIGVLKGGYGIEEGRVIFEAGSGTDEKNVRG